MICTLVCCSVVGKAAPGASISVVHMYIERAEGEISSALALIVALLIWLSCPCVHVMLLHEVSVSGPHDFH